MSLDLFYDSRWAVSYQQLQQGTHCFHHILKDSKAASSKAADMSQGLAATEFAFFMGPFWDLLPLPQVLSSSRRAPRPPPRHQRHPRCRPRQRRCRRPRRLQGPRRRRIVLNWSCLEEAAHDIIMLWQMRWDYFNDWQFWWKHGMMLNIDWDLNLNIDWD